MAWTMPRRSAGGRSRRGASSRRSTTSTGSRGETSARIRAARLSVGETDISSALRPAAGFLELQTLRFDERAGDRGMDPQLLEVRRHQFPAQARRSIGKGSDAAVEDKSEFEARIAVVGIHGGAQGAKKGDQLGVAGMQQ